MDPLELQPPNIFDVATDPLDDPGRVNIYAACSRMGVYAITLDVDAGFVSDSRRLVTPGSAHSVSVQDTGQGRLLLVGDLSSGTRFYRRP